MAWSSCESAWGEAEASLLGDAEALASSALSPLDDASLLGDALLVGDALLCEPPVVLSGLLVVVGDALLVVVGEALLLGEALLVLP